MKQKDLVLLVVIVFISGFASVIVCNKLLLSPKTRNQKVEVVEKITPDFRVPDPANFNSQAVNPTQTIQIAPGSNTKPFANQ